ncbi:MAG: hypothetical protein WBN97_11475 [Parvibaculum sp.]
MSKNETSPEPFAIVHIDEEGNISFRKSPGCRLFVIDDAYPVDRIYEYTTDSKEPLTSFVPEGEIVNRNVASDETIAKFLRKEGRLN